MDLGARDTLALCFRVLGLVPWAGNGLEGSGQPGTTAPTCLPFFLWSHPFPASRKMISTACSPGEVVRTHIHTCTHLHTCVHMLQPLAEVCPPGRANYRPLSPGNRLVPAEQAGGTGPIGPLRALSGIDLQMLRWRSFLSAKLAGSKSGTATSHISPSLESRRRKPTARGR